jgi:hypothetical protein
MYIHTWSDDTVMNSTNGVLVCIDESSNTDQNGIGMKGSNVGEIKLGR